MLINTFLDTEDFVHLYYPEDEAGTTQGCGAGARMASKYPARPPSPEYSQVVSPSTSEMSDRERYRAPPQPEPPPRRARAADLFPRLRTHYDEPGLDVGFIPICGEFVQWVGRTTDGGTVAMSNYRLHTQPRRRNGPGTSVPLRLIDALEIRDLLHLVILCKHGRQLKCTFNSGEQCLEWWRRLNTALAPMGSVQDTFAAAYAAWAKEQSLTSVHRALMKASHAPQRHWFGPEVERLGFTSKGAWRVSAANAEYKLCPSYPPLLIVPASICDEDLDSVARFRAMRRVPAVVWRHRGNGAVIARSSQPEVGWLGWRSSEDERLLAAFVSACNADRGMHPPNPNKQLKLLIVDARSYASAVTNRARGGGCECQQYYPAADIQFMCLPNIHHVRRSFQQMRALAAEPSDQANWLSSLERTLWPTYVAGVCRAACVAARAVLAGRPVLVHCSDGWDRTPQIVAAAQLVLDPYYRTIEGFRVLVEREWLDFGHKFADRCGHQFGPEDPNERSPIFLQWLDVVHQLMLQYPCSFEFNEAYLIKLGTHVHSCMFGTFLCNTRRERGEARLAEGAAHVWPLLAAPAYRNHLYTPVTHHQVVWPECSVRATAVWRALFAAEDERAPPPAPLASAPPAPHGLMTKTRSCDNLLNEGEKRTAQRRCSDPSLAPDVMKLSMVVAEGERGGECRAALTDSCVDDLPLLPLDNGHDHDQVDGLHPDHFENETLPRDIASGSSSLERELARVVDIGKIIDHTDTVIDHTDKVTDHTDTVIDHTDKVIDHTDKVIVHTDTVIDHADTVIDHTDVVIDHIVEPVRADGVGDGDVTPPRVNGDSDLSESVIRVGTSPDEPAVFLCDTFSDVMGIDRDKRVLPSCVSGRARTVSITWRSLSESSSHSEPEPPAAAPVSASASASAYNGLHHHTANFQEVDHNGAATSCSTSLSSEGEEAGARLASQLTLCPASPPHGARGGPCCVCGAAGARAGADPLDGLPPAADPLQDRLHQIILYQKKVVEELSGQLRSAREALRLASPPPTQKAAGSAACSVSGSSSSGGSSASEVEVGEEARGVEWLPDSAAPRCQYCSNHFWLARRRHHCRRCGGVFCGSCSEMSSWGDCARVRVCRRCRALR